VIREDAITTSSEVQLGALGPQSEQGMEPVDHGKRDRSNEVNELAPTAQGLQ
jgi:hypothetical protein